MITTQAEVIKADLLAFLKAYRRGMMAQPHRMETPMVTPRTRLIAGVSVPDSPLITEVLEYAQKLSEDYLFNHAMRSWLFAAKIGHIKAIDCDHEVIALGTILYDIGLTAGVSGSNRFEVNGANAALSFIKERGFSDRRAQLIWDLVALNSTPSIALHKEAEVAVGTMGIGQWRIWP